MNASGKNRQPPAREAPAPTIQLLRRKMHVALPPLALLVALVAAAAGLVVASWEGPSLREARSPCPPPTVEGQPDQAGDSGAAQVVWQGPCVTWGAFVRVGKPLGRFLGCTQDGRVAATLPDSCVL